MSARRRRPGRGRGRRGGTRAGRHGSRRKTGKNALAIGFLVAVVLIMLGLIVWGQIGPRPALDAANCPEDGSYAAQVAVLLDPSDTLTAVQEMSAGNRLFEFFENDLPETAAVGLFDVGRAGRGDTAAAYRVCRPEHPDSVWSFTGNPDMAARSFNEDYLGPLRDTVNVLLGHSAQASSPIIEAIQVAAVNAFRPRDAAVPRHLIVVSDMLQNSTAASFYDGVPDLLSLARNPDYGTLKVDLSGVNVVVFLLSRRGEAGRIQAGMRQFWEDYFADQGVGFGGLSWVRIEG